MSSLNKAMIIGRLGQDPEVRYTQNNTAVANMSVATSEKFKDSNGEYQERTEWHKVVAWGRLAEICQQYLVKGSQVYFEGPIQTRKWTNKDGQDQYTTEIKALQMVMLDNRKAGQDNSGGQQSGSGPQQQGQSNQPAVNTDTGEVDQDIDDDLPF